MPETDTIVIKAPPGTKARWVHKSQSQGQKLSDWVSRWACPVGAPVVVMTEDQVRELLRTAYLAGAWGAQ